MFWVLNEKMILLKKNKYKNYFLVGLSAIYLLKSVLHLKYEKITVINNTQLIHYIGTGSVHRRVFAMTGSSLYLKFI